ncbi:hypothetical protein SEVIR_7G066600v4 [Setaria viridis]|uniref:Uncharacterized protein n=1 Tax=Setaria viridis TaxID=4556 RepID=A0A4U6TMI0_SETVI|nr:hypothetical protein SEVIR_7G066600v2 [Setaria viridis]
MEPVPSMLVGAVLVVGALLSPIHPPEEIPHAPENAASRSYMTWYCKERVGVYDLYWQYNSRTHTVKG